MKTTREKEFDDLWAKALAEEDRIEAKANKSKLGHEKAIWAVDRARVELQNLGYTVSIPEHVCSNGADLTIQTSGKGENWRFAFVEVKLARWNKNAWCVNRVTRKEDDYIAIVFPSGHVHFESLRDHLKLCNKSGDRYLTTLGRLFE